jgi:hypothetical protein
MPRNIRDANLVDPCTLPAAAGSAYSNGLDLQLSARADGAYGCELIVEAPALTTGQLPDTKTITYDIQVDTDPAFGTVATLLAGVLVQTGAAGAGAAAAAKRIGIASDLAKRYLRLRAIGGAAIGDCSAAKANLSLVF